MITFSRGICMDPFFTLVVLADYLLSYLCDFSNITKPCLEIKSFRDLILISFDLMDCLQASFLIS